MKHPMMKTLSMLILLAASPLSLHAQTTAEMKEQAAETLAESDQAMNTAYQKLLKILSEEGQKRLRASQRAWVAFRDAQASFDSHHLEGGTAEGLERLGSLNGLTEERTKRLTEDYERFKEFAP